jgi:hypothetical protein
MTANYVNQSQDNFAKARMRARIGVILSALQFKRRDLLSLYDVKRLIKPKSEAYLGVKAIPIDKIVGSEGRYQDFNLAFLPKKNLLKGRWQSIDQAHMKYVELPPISVYKVGEVYFVRDGNHRVSVAKSRGIEFVDASIVELGTEISPEPGMSMKRIRSLVVEYERKRFLEDYEIPEDSPLHDIRFSVPGRYTEMLHHIEVHKYFLNEDKEGEIPFAEAADSWYEHIYNPIIEVVRSENMLFRFPERTEGDLYMWILAHREDLKDTPGQDIPADTVAQDLSKRFGTSLYERILAFLKRIFSKVE